MEKELIKFKRRPFMLPLLLPLVLLAVAAVVIIWVLDMRATTIVIVATSAEIEANTDPTAGNPDPNLSLAGRERAARLARVLAQVQSSRGVDTIFASETRRTQQTVAPLAESLSLPINILPAASWSNLPDRIKQEQTGKVVLVVGSNATLPPLIHAISGQAITVGESEVDSLYVLFVPQLSRTRLLQLRY